MEPLYVGTDLLQQLVEQLDPQHAVSEQQLTALISKHQNNLRNCLRELYDNSFYDNS